MHTAIFTRRFQVPSATRLIAVDDAQCFFEVEGVDWQEEFRGRFLSQRPSWSRIEVCCNVVQLLPFPCPVS
jgi:hypothetical protein